MLPLTTFQIGVQVVDPAVEHEDRDGWRTQEAVRPGRVGLYRAHVPLASEAHRSRRIVGAPHAGHLARIDGAELGHFQGEGLVRVHRLDSPLAHEAGGRRA